MDPSVLEWIGFQFDHFFSTVIGRYFVKNEVYNNRCDKPFCHRYLRAVRGDCVKEGLEHYCLLDPGYSWNGGNKTYISGTQVGLISSYILCLCLSVFVCLCLSFCVSLRLFASVRLSVCQSLTLSFSLSDFSCRQSVFFLGRKLDRICIKLHIVIFRCSEFRRI